MSFDCTFNNRPLNESAWAREYKSESHAHLHVNRKVSEEDTQKNIRRRDLEDRAWLSQQLKEVWE